jgi:hypothetical protein
LFWTHDAGAAVCTVPSGSHPTIQEAVDDVGCTEVTLAAQTFVESVAVDRSLSITGASTATTVVEGRFEVTGAASVIALSEMTIDAAAPSVAGCFREALDVSGGAQLTGSALVVVNRDGDACLIFGDGFETGSTSAWSSATP